MDVPELPAMVFVEILLSAGELCRRRIQYDKVGHKESQRPGKLSKYNHRVITQVQLYCMYLYDVDRHDNERIFGALGLSSSQSAGL